MLDFKTTLNSWLCGYRKGRLQGSGGDVWFTEVQASWLFEGIGSGGDEAEVPTPCQRPSSCARSLCLGVLLWRDCSYPTYTVTNSCFFVHWFISPLPCVVFSQAETFSLGEVMALPWVLCHPLHKKTHCFGQCPVGLCLAPPSHASCPEPSPASFNHASWSLFGFFHPSEMLELCLMPQTLSLPSNPPWKPISFAAFIIMCPHGSSFGLSCMVIKLNAYRPEEF